MMTLEEFYEIVIKNDELEITHQTVKKMLNGENFADDFSILKVGLN